MDDTPINLENILEQAPKWTFAGDFTLLQWMNQISQDLETRATKTTEALTKLNNNVRSTNIALDNVANSLTTLQFGNQFVECRVQDDDETLANANEASSDGENPEQHTPTSKEMLNKFLDNNLKVLRNCHEKYSIDLDDSDEEDEGKSKEKTCIYQPINPYNEKPLPYIFGSKDWHAKWHVGLYENQQENSYSGDEISEAFSESSSTSHLDDNESFESNTEWASSNSIDNDNINTNIEVKNASSLRGSQALYPGTPSLPIKAIKNKSTISESSSLSTPSSSLVKKSIHITKQTENVTQRSESKNSINSKNSTKTPAKVSTYNKENTMQHKQQAQPYLDLFAEPPSNEEVESTTSSSVSSAQNVIPPPDNNRTITTERPSAFRRSQPPPFVDLFAEPPEDIPSSTTSSSISSGRNIKRKTVNLFDDDEDDMAKDDLLSVLTKAQESVKPTNDENKSLPPAKTNIVDKPLKVSKTPKSLFEDSDDEDDDFLKAFVQRSSSKEATKTSLTKTLLFDNEFQEPSLNTKSITNSSKEASKTTLTNALLFDNELQEPSLITKSLPTDIVANHKTRNIFNDTNDNGDDLNLSKTKDDPKKPMQMPKADASNKTAVEKTNVGKSVNLFDDFEDVENIDNLNKEKKPKKINLFDDLEEEDVEDLFSKKPKQTSTKDISQENTLRENVAKSLEVVKEKNNLETNTIYNTSIVKDTPTSEVTTTDEDHNKSNKIAIEDDNIDQNKTMPEITENKENNVSTENENKDQTQAEPFKTEDKLLESSSLETKSIESNHKELNNNDNISIMQENNATDSLNETQQPSSSNKYDFNSVLLFDEPPEDDDEFFETLSKTPLAHNTNYNAIDLENDIYEPELPQVPVASASNNLADTIDNRQSKLYTGLQLFSDVPPDDDGVSDTTNLPPESNQTKRLHSVFYDDFNETLMALNQNKIEKDIPKHSIFSEEPPPINEELNSSSSKDLIDHKVPEVKQEFSHDEHKIKGSQIAAKLEETLSKSDNKKDSTASNKRPVSKLQMPHININVQALLPGANNSLRKVKEDTTKVIDQGNATIKPALSVSPALTTKKEATVLTNQTVEVRKTAETEHILPSVTKNRVRGPAARRPSTRRARQENYRKSLIEEAATLESEDEKNEVRNQTMQTKTNIPKNPLTQVQPENNNGEIQKQMATEDIPKTLNKCSKEEPALPSILSDKKGTDNSKISNISKSTTLEINKKINNEDLSTPLPSILSDNKDTDNSEIDNISKSSTLEINKETNILNEGPQSSSSTQNNQSLSKTPVFDKTKEKNSTDIFKQIQSTNKLNKNDDNKSKSAQTKSILFFDDDEEEDDDLFKHIKTSKTNVNKAQATTRETNAKLQPDKKIVSSSANLLANNTNMEVTKEVTVPPILNSTAATHSVTTTTSNYKNQQSSKDDKQSQSNKKSSTKPAFLYDEGGDLFRRTDQKPTTSNTFKDSNSIAKSQFRSFLDSESDEDLNVAGLQSPTSTHTKTSSSTKPPIVSAPPPKNSTAKLFADSDTDSDDLFGKLASAKTTKTTKTSNKKVSSESTSKSQIKAPAKSSLFSDESDGDDFPISSGSIKKNTVPKSTLKDNKPKINTQTNTSLFSDVDSDEDDLFGSGTAKVSTTTGTNIPNSKAPSTTKPLISTTEVTKPKTVADNPLADLL
ncbi:WASH complex subunit 2 isoform X2 [Calliphora vicina]|uniref:WASH complex subunit 2 isoform X2 n=1 Tax=Calliphora vicina TaxID=7373 RepID=UPI00325A506A